MATWEMSKENIQPLRHGRRVSSIEEHDQKKILKEQQWVDRTVTSMSRYFQLLIHLKDALVWRNKATAFWFYPKPITAAEKGANGVIEITTKKH